MDEILGFDSRKAPVYAMAAAADYVTGATSTYATFELEAPADRAVYIVEAHVSLNQDVLAIAPESSTHITASLNTVTIAANFGGFDATATFRTGVASSAPNGESFLLDGAGGGKRYFYPLGLYIPPGKIFVAKTETANVDLSAGFRWVEFPI